MEKLNFLSNLLSTVIGGVMVSVIVKSKIMHSKFCLPKLSSKTQKILKMIQYVLMALLVALSFSLQYNVMRLGIILNASQLLTMVVACFVPAYILVLVGWTVKEDIESLILQSKK